MEVKLPPEFDTFLAELADVPEEVRVMWRYAIVLAMLDDEKARIIEERKDGDAHLIVVQTLAGDRLEVVRPPLSDETERELLLQIRAIMSSEETSEE